MSVNMEDLKIAFELLGFGWGGVFVVLFIIYLASKLLTKLFPIKNKGGYCCEQRIYNEKNLVAKDKKLIKLGAN